MSSLTYHHAHMNCVFPCKCTRHESLISDFCLQLISVLKTAASEYVKRKLPNITKPLWSDELSKLKIFSVEAHALRNAR